MSTIPVVPIQCDGPSCYAQPQCAEHTAAVTRSYARAEGWHVNLKGGRDICPDCWRQGHR